MSAYGSNIGESELVILVLTIYGLILLPLLLVSIAAWVLNSLGLYRIAARRGISHAWLAWLPYGSNWILGSISDDYNLTVNGVEKNRRSLLLWLGVGTLVFSMVSSCCSSYGPAMMGDSASGLGASAVLSVLVSLAASGVGIVITVFSWICTYDLFKSCRPDKATMYLIISIVSSLFGLSLSALFVFLCRNSDEGMLWGPEQYVE